MSLLGKPKIDDIKALDSLLAQNFIDGIKVERYKNFEQLFASHDPQKMDFIKKLLCFNPKQRLTSTKALEHPYLKYFHNPNEEIECPYLI